VSCAFRKRLNQVKEAFDTGLLQHGKDIIVVNKDRQIAEAKKHALLMAEAGYTQPIRRTDVKVLGTSSRNVLSRNRPNGGG
jgi:3-hydroxyacyl-CoA dehydrogenase